MWDVDRRATTAREAMTTAHIGRDVGDRGQA